MVMKFLIEIQWQAKRIITINPWSWCELGIAAAQVLQDMSLHHRDRVLMRNSGNSSENTKRSLIHLSCCVFSYLACLMTSHHISRLLCFAPWMIFSSLVIDFDNIRATLYTIEGRFVLSCCIFFVGADLLQSLLYLYDVPDASTSFQACIQYCWCVPEVLYEMLAMQCICFCVSICFLILFALLHYQSSTWHDKIAPVRLTPVAKLSLNK